MTTKSKEIASFQSEMHLLSPLPIELVIQRIQESKTFVVSIKNLSADESNFELESVYPKKLKLVGKLLRWDGRFTRLDVQCTNQSALESSKFILPFASLILLVIVLLNGWNSLTSFLYSPITICLLPMMLLPFALLVLPLLIGTSSAFFVPNDYETQKTINTMLHSFADKLTESSDEILEFDGSELSLELLLQEEKYKHFRLGADGEIPSP